MLFERFKGEILNVSRPPLEIPEFNKPMDNVLYFQEVEFFLMTIKRISA